MPALYFSQHVRYPAFAPVFLPNFKDATRLTADFKMICIWDIWGSGIRRWHFHAGFQCSMPSGLAAALPHVAIPRIKARMKVMDAHGLDDRPGSNLCHRRFNTLAQDRLSDRGHRCGEAKAKDQDAVWTRSNNVHLASTVAVTVRVTWILRSMRVVPTAESKLAHLEDCTADLQISHIRHRFSIDLVDVDDVVVDDGSDQISERPTVQQLVDLPRLKTVLDGLQIFGIGKPPGWRTEFLALDLSSGTILLKMLPSRRS